MREKKETIQKRREKRTKNRCGKITTSKFSRFKPTRIDKYINLIKHSDFKAVIIILNIKQDTTMCCLLKTEFKTLI